MACKQIAVAGIQISQVMGNRQANISTAMEAITAAPGHDIYVLPELSSSGYCIGVFQALKEARRIHPYLTDRNIDMYCTDERGMK